MVVDRSAKPNTRPPTKIPSRIQAMGTRPARPFHFMLVTEPSWSRRGGPGSGEAGPHSRERTLLSGCQSSAGRTTASLYTGNSCSLCAANHPVEDRNDANCLGRSAGWVAMRPMSGLPAGARSRLGSRPHRTPQSPTRSLVPLGQRQRVVRQRLPAPITGQRGFRNWSRG